MRAAKYILALGAICSGVGLAWYAATRKVTPGIRGTVVRIAKGEIGNSRWEKYIPGTSLQTPGYRISWCGIFALWVLHRAGLAENVKWNITTGDGFLFRLPVTKDPLPGDIGYLHNPYQHHTIVEKVVGDTIYTIEGNAPPGSSVRRKKRPRSEFTSFHSIAPFIRDVTVL